MKKNDVFTFIAPNKVKVIGVVLHMIDNSKWTYNYKEKCYNFNYLYLCYAQNRLCIMQTHEIQEDNTNETRLIKVILKEVVVNYAILPDYDELLAKYNDLEIAQAETNLGM